MKVCLISLVIYVFWIVRRSWHLLILNICLSIIESGIPTLQVQIYKSRKVQIGKVIRFCTFWRQKMYRKITKLLRIGINCIQLNWKMMTVCFLILFLEDIFTEIQPSRPGCLVCRGEYLAHWRGPMAMPSSPEMWPQKVLNFSHVW